MNVYWLEQVIAEVPTEDDWLSAGEARCLGSMRIAKRRADWRLGRWTAKRAVAACLELPEEAEALRRIEVRAAPSGAPEVFLGAESAGVTISISHRASTAACAVAGPGVELGCDLELIEPRSDGFVEDYLTVDEQRMVAEVRAEDRARLVNLLWSAKESALKALREGLRLDTRVVAVTSTRVCVNGWGSLEVETGEGRVFRGWWREAEELLRTVVAIPPPGVPKLVQLGPFSRQGPKEGRKAGALMFDLRSSVHSITPPGA